MSRILWYNEGEQKRRPRAVTLAAVDKRTVHLMNDNTSKTIEIPLTKGYVAIVDECDADLLGFKWRAFLSHETRAYGVRYISVGGERAAVFLHKAIFQRKSGVILLKGQMVDHEDNNPLNNRRSNLRLADSVLNGRNRKLNKNSTSGFKGVSYRKERDTWLARITVNAQTINLGTFKTPEDAYRAYCKAAKKYFGEFARFE